MKNHLSHRKGIPLLQVAFLGAASLIMGAPAQEHHSSQPGAGIPRTASAAAVANEPTSATQVNTKQAEPEKIWTAADGLVGVPSDYFNKFRKTLGEAPPRPEPGAAPSPPPPPVDPAKIVVPQNKLLDVQQWLPAEALRPDRPSRHARWSDAALSNDNVCAVRNSNGRQLGRWSEAREIRRIVTELSDARDDGLTTPEQQFQRACLNTVPVPQDMARYDRHIIDQLLNDADFMDNISVRFSQWEKLPENATRMDKAIYFERRQSDLQFIADKLRAAYDLPPALIAVVPLPEHWRVYGLFHAVWYQGKPAILLNSTPELSVMDDPYRALHTLIEEVRHSIDNDMTRMLVGNQLRPDDPRFLHASLVRLNQWGANSSPQLDPKTWRYEDQSYFDYENQYLERTAKIFRCALADAITTRTVARITTHMRDLMPEQGVALNVPDLRHTTHMPLQRPG